MNIFRNWLASSVEEVHAQGGLLAVFLYLVVGMYLLLATTVFLVAMFIASILLVPALIFLQVLVWISAKLSTRNKTRFSSARM
jgi:energy-converting hydrogenase Eha subunit F